MENIIPLRYRLKIYPNSETKRFKGHVEIDLEIKKKTRTIKLNAKGLDIKNASVSSGKSIVKTKTRLISENEELDIILNTQVKGRATLSIDYEGLHNENLYGFYLSKYKEGGKESKILTTQFESSDARAAFPCFDKPSMKAVFEVTLIIDKELDAISNMPVKEAKLLGDKKEVLFYPTPKMSTYLVYMGVGKFEYLSSNAGGIKIRAITRPGQKSFAKISLLFAKQFVLFYEKYFGIKYPLPKLDLIALPDFSAGAMENWGAITFREIDFLIDPKKISLTMKRQVADTVAHEIAHQWFGDLVTMEWWDDLWLNESFATYMSMKAVDSVYKNWHVELDYFIDTVSTAFSADQLKTTHPINVKVDTPAEIESIFDSISYNKGGSVLRMLEDYAGSEIFRKGLHRYLKKHAYSNAKKQDLWNAIEVEAKRSGKKLYVSKIAKAWINTAGYPLIKLQNGKEPSITQEKFTILGDTKNILWPVPITYFYSKNGISKIGKILLTNKTAKLENNFDLIKLNYNQKGFYRSSYEEEYLEVVGSAIKSGILKSIDGCGVEGDLFALLIGRKISLDKYLNFVSNYLLNSGYPLNIQLSSHLIGLYFKAYDLEVSKSIKNVAIEFLVKNLKKIGMKPKKEENEQTSIFRSHLISGLGMLGDKNIINFSMKNLDTALYSNNIVPEIRNAIYTVAAFNGNEKIFDMIKSAYVNEEFPEKKIYLLSSLSLFSRKDLARRALDMTFSSDVKLQDSYIIPYHMSTNPFGKELVLEFIKDKWQFIKKQFEPGTHMLGRFVESLSTQVGEDKLEEIHDFFAMKENFSPTIKKELKETLEKIEINTKFREFLSK
ncbi:MAG: M1 family metallopeptidase [Candidatus Micrarchaeia archaeon]